jgi:hypothetical protein
VSAGAPARNTGHPEGTELTAKAATTCPAQRVPGVTATDAFNAAHQAARTQSAVFIGVERSGRAWTARADTLTAAPHHAPDDATSEAVRTAVTHLVRDRAIDSGSSPGPVHITLYGVPDVDDAVGAGRGQIVGPARRCAGEPLPKLCEQGIPHAVCRPGAR